MFGIHHAADSCNPYCADAKDINNAKNSQRGHHSTERDDVLLADAKIKLKTGNIIIGERHDAPAARDFLSKLIEAGDISDIYLEFPDLECDIFGGEGDVKLSTYFNSTEYEQLIQQSVFNDFRSDCAAITGAVDNDIALPDVIAIARKHQVQVHFIDNHIPKSHHFLDRAKERNTGMAEHFNLLKQNEKGVILVGANHCHLGENSLQHLCEIADNAIYDLSL